MKKIIKSIIKSIAKGVVYLWFKIYYRLEIKGLENIPKEGSVIFCANHRSYLDPPLMIVSAKRDLHFMIKIFI